MNTALILAYKCQMMGAELEDFIDHFQDPPQDPMLQEEMEKLAQVMRQTADLLESAVKPELICPRNEFVCPLDELHKED